MSIDQAISLGQILQGGLIIGRRDVHLVGLPLIHEVLATITMIRVKDKKLQDLVQ